MPEILTYANLSCLYADTNYTEELPAIKICKNTLTTGSPIDLLEQEMSKLSKLRAADVYRHVP